MDLSVICRTCLSQKQDLIHIFNGDEKDLGKGLKLSDVLSKIANIEIFEGDNMPTTICVECAKELARAYQFVEKVQKSDKALRQCHQDQTWQDETLGEPFQSLDSSLNTPPEETLYGNLDDKFLLSKLLTEDHLTMDTNSTKSVQFNSNETSKINTSDSNKSVYNCNYCTQAFTNKYALDKHNRDHEFAKMCACKQCQNLNEKLSFKEQEHKDDSEHTRKPQNIIDDKMKYVCNICEEGFKLSNHYNLHMKSHASEQKMSNAEEASILCTFCGKGFPSLSLLRYHYRSHKGLKPFICEVCKKRYSTLGNLRTHMRQHPNEKPFICGSCEKGFNNSGDLKKHQLVHKGPNTKTIKCTLCPKVYSKPVTLTNHMRIHTGAKPFSCCHCNESFNTKTELRYHMQTHPKEKPYRCVMCGRIFKRSSTLKTHIMGMHKGMIKMSKKTAQ